MFIVHIGGHLGKDPETRFTQEGKKVTSFSIATKQRKGKEDVTVWVRVTVWDEKMEKIVSTLKKGSGVIVTGRMKPPSTYTDKEGKVQVSLDITAELIEYSPFGRTDRQDGQNQGAVREGNASGYSTSYQQPSSQFQANTPYQQTQSQYNPQASGQGNFTADEEENIPF